MSLNQTAVGEDLIVAEGPKDNPVHRSLEEIIEEAASMIGINDYLEPLGWTKDDWRASASNYGPKIRSALLAENTAFLRLLNPESSAYRSELLAEDTASLRLLNTMESSVSSTLFVVDSSVIHSFLHSEFQHSINYVDSERATGRIISLMGYDIDTDAIRNLAVEALDQEDTKRFVREFLQDALLILASRSLFSAKIKHLIAQTVVTISRKETRAWRPQAYANEDDDAHEFLSHIANEEMYVRTDTGSRTMRQFWSRLSKRNHFKPIAMAVQFLKNHVTTSHVHLPVHLPQGGIRWTTNKSLSVTVNFGT